MSGSSAPLACTTHVCIATRLRRAARPRLSEPSALPARPHESGLFLRRYCYIEEYNEHEQLFSKRGLPWAEALCEYALPLRALVLFHTRKHLLEDRAFPQWAVHSIEAAILSSGPLEA